MTPHISTSDPRTEFAAISHFCLGLGLDIGCGTNRLSPTVLSTDNYPHEDADLIWNSAEKPFPFQNNTFDFVFASHVLEDFPPNIIQSVFNEWLRIVKPNGLLIILVPDMFNKRYPDFNETFPHDHPDVISGKRKQGELIGNPSHQITMGLPLLNQLQNNSTFKSVTIQADSLPHNQMTLDFIIRKL